MYTRIVGSGCHTFLDLLSEMSHEIQGLHVAAVKGDRFPIHPAFQFQAYPLYPSNLLAAIRQPTNGIPKQRPARNMGPYGSRSMLFNINAILTGSPM
ncbi:hypothetical protein LSH36_278g00027 [Paralvinella palmiformis]|uniref:Uncharacterized protein n=1 Tax=Paralvinella palmiformis TaxID=53620 RepID=A0AAD9JKA6_9ANNE|nr:hypothetical protein LSH36_278g00027 [Paralvinella palmiformis]